LAPTLESGQPPPLANTAATIIQEIKHTIDLDSTESGAFFGGALPAFFGDIVSSTVPILTQVADPQSANVSRAFAQFTGQPIKAKGEMMSSRSVRLTIPEPLAKRIDALKGEDELQDFILAALRERVYGSPVEAHLRAEVERLHQTRHAFGGGSARAQPKPEALLHTLLGQSSEPVAPHGELQDPPIKLRW
jgi:hypothetical protein